MSAALQLNYSYSEYLNALASSELRLEFCDGTIYAMAGGPVGHAELTARITELLGRTLGDRCRRFSSALKVRIDSTNAAMFPDVTVVCGTLETATNDAHALLNPTLLVEVTSTSTERHDRSEKLSQYKQIPSLRAVLFISHRSATVTVVERAGSEWNERNFRSSETVVIETPSVSFSVDEVYRAIALDVP